MCSPNCVRFFSVRGLCSLGGNGDAGSVVVVAGSVFCVAYCVVGAGSFFVALAGLTTHSIPISSA